MKYSPPAILLVFVTGAACIAAPPAQLPSQPPAQPAQPTAPPLQQARSSEAITRADALVEDFKRRQEAQEKYDREHPLPPAVPLPGLLPATQAIPSAAGETNAPVASGGTGVATATPGRDEKWWRDQMQALELALNEQEIRLAAAEKANLKYGYNDAQAEYKKIVAAVQSAREAIEKLRDEARRAGVPPGWLR